jgi:protein-tyrosine phosphatase
MVKILFVCLGNICRSPLAEAVFNHKIKTQGLEKKFTCDSCGTLDYHIGELPDERTLKCAKHHGIPIRHRGRQINRTDIREFHYLIVMDESNKKNILKLIDQNGLQHDQIYLLREFQPSAEHPDVPDPYYGGEEGFEQVYQILDDSIDHLLKFLKTEHKIYVQ